jgi:hypothetical protein
VFKILEPKFPSAVEVERPSDWNGESWPDRRRVSFKFPAISGRDGFELVWIDGEGAAPEASELPHWPQGEAFGGHGLVMVGERGSIHFMQSHLQEVRVLPLDLAAQHGPPPAQPAPGGMHDDFLAAAKGDMAWDAPEGNFMFGGLMTAASLLGNAAQFSSTRKIEADPETGAVANAEAAVSAYLNRTPRPDWRAP